MKRCLILIISFIITNFCLCMESKHDIEFRFNSNDKKDKAQYDINIEFSDYIKDVYFFSKANINNLYGSDKSNMQRFYIEFYNKDLTYTLGRQRVYFGFSNVFNLADIFHIKDITEPDKEENGADCINIEFFPKYFSKIQFVHQFKESKNDSTGFRYTFLKDNYEYGINYIKYSDILGDHENAVIEFKGDLNQIGFWSQYSKNISHIDEEMFMTGLDHSFDHKNKSYYITSEYIDYISKKIDYFYSDVNITLDEFSSLSFNFMSSSQNSKEYGGLYYQYFLNDLSTVYLYYKRFFNNTVITTNTGNNYEFIMAYKIIF